MKSNKTKALFQYWDNLRDGRKAPKRTEIEPADIRTLLADTFVLDCMLPEPTFRLAGTRLCSIYGQELKGFSFASLWSEREGAIFSKLIEETVSSGQVVVVNFDGVSRNQRVCPFEVIVMPLSDEGSGARALGSFVALQPEFWLGADPIRDGRITAIRVIDPEREPLYLKNRPSIPVAPKMQPDPSAISPLAYRDKQRPRSTPRLIVLPGGKEESPSP